MKPSIYAAMAAAAVVLGGVYAYVERGRESSYAASASAGPFFPDLAASINDVQAVRIEHEDQTFTIARGEKGWGMESKGGFPVDSGKVRALLLGMKDAEAVEQKTSDPARHAKLGLLEPGAPEASSKRVTVIDAAGKELASVIVGEPRGAQGGMPPSGSRAEDAFYVRRSGEDQTWLVEGDIQVETDAARWLERDIVNIDRARVRAAQVVTADGERLFVSKASKDATNFDVANVPEGRELRYEGAANSYGSALTNLTLDDVVPASEVTFDDPPTAVTTFWTFDHLRVDVTLQERDEKLYAKIETSYDDVGATAAGAPEPPPPPPPAEETPSDEDAAATDAAAEEDAATDADAEPADDAAAEPAGPTPEDVQKEAEEIRARTQSWVYVLPTWKKSSFMKRMDELLKELTPPEGETPAEGIDGVPFEDVDGMQGLDELLQDATTGSEDDGAAPEANESTGDAPPPAEETGDASGDEGATPPPDETGAGGGDAGGTEPPPSDEPKPDDAPPPPPQDPPQDGGGDGGR